MKFHCLVDINLPMDRVLELFQDPENLPKWQDGFISLEHISGTPWEPEAKSKILYQQGSRKIELEETILVNNLPTEFLARYEHKHMINNMQVVFTAIDANTTRYDCHIEYTKFNGFLPKMMAFLFPSMFRKQTQKWLDQFKVFAEEGKTVL